MGGGCWGQWLGRNGDLHSWWSLGKDKKQAGECALTDELKLPKEVDDKICQGNAE